MTTPVPRHNGLGSCLDFRLLMVEKAHEDWLDPGAPDDYAREIGWRTGHGDDWCGIWLGAVGIRAGLDKQIALRVMPSTYRLNTNRPSEPGWSQVRKSPPEPVRPADVRAGDIVTLETSRGLAYGDHIEIVYAVLGDKIYTYGANTRAGITSDLEKPVRRSVCRCVRDIKSVRRVYRLGNRHREAC